MKPGLVGKSIKYSDGYAGQLRRDAVFQLPENLWPPEDIRTEWVDITCGGIMTCKRGYAWDYASLPLFKKLGNWVQGKKSKTPSLAHDALCQLERDMYLADVPDARLHADEFFKYLLDERHFFKLRGRIWFWGVRIGSRGKSSNKPILEAP